MAAKPVRSKLNRASAHRGLRTLGALMAITASDEKRANGWGQRPIVAYRFTKGQSRILDHHWLLDSSGNCWQSRDSWKLSFADGLRFDTDFDTDFDTTL